MVKLASNVFHGWIERLLTSSDLQVSYPIVLAFMFLQLRSPGFNYKFNALSDDPEKNELMKAFSTLFKAVQKISVIPSLRAMYPVLRFLVRTGVATSLLYHLIYIWLQPAPTDAVRANAAAVMSRIGKRLLKQSKGYDSSQRKNILSILAHANTMEEKAHQMKDEDVLSRAYKLNLNLCIFWHTLRDPYFPPRWSCNNKVRTFILQTLCNEIHKFRILA